MERLVALLRLTGANRRAQLVSTLLLMVAGAAAELALLGAVVPMLAAFLGMSTPALPFNLPLSAGQAAALFAVAAIAAAALRLALIRHNSLVVRDIGHDLATRVFGNAIRLPLAAHGQQNSSAFLSGVEQVNRLAYSVLLPALNAVVSAFILLVIVMGMLAIQPRAALAGLAVIGFAYAVALVLARRRLRRHAAALAEAERRRIQVVQESLGAIRDIILDRSWRVSDRAFADVDARCRRLQAELSFTAASPRPVVEAVVIVGAALLFATWEGSTATPLPVLGALLLAGLRLIPLAQGIYTGLAHSAGYAGAIEVVLDLARPAPSTEPVEVVPALAFEETITCCSLGFGYPAGPPILGTVDLLIPRGARVGFTGPTGGGKSTLLDLIMGLIEPTHGVVAVDGVPLSADNRSAWHRRIAHVPQSVFLADASIAANIALGDTGGAPDIRRVEDAAERAELGPFIRALPGGFDTTVGERGVRLSGGQRQRIGLARAFYKGADVFVLDEATSALDARTEEAVLRSIQDLPPTTTVIVVAHRPSALAICDTVHQVADGRVTAGAE